MDIQPKRSNSFRIAVFLLVVITLWMMSGVLKDGEGDQVKNVTASYKIPKVRVNTLVAELRNELVTVYGYTEAVRDVALKAEVAGKIEKIIAKEGSTLKKGEPILQIANRDRQQKLSEADSRVKQRELEYNAAKSLSSKGFQAATKLAEAKADLDMALASRAQAKMDFDNITIRAPFDGYLEKLDIEVGDIVTASGEDSYLGQYVESKTLLAVGYVSEREVDEVQVGAPAMIRLVNGDEIQAVVSYVASVSEPATRTFRVEVRMDNEFGDISSGSTAEIIILTGEEDAHFIPTSVLTLNNAGDLGVKVFKSQGGDLKTVENAAGQGLVSFVPVETREDTGKGMWVFGLPDVVDLIVLGQAFVDDGDIVIGVDNDGNPIGVTIERNN